MASIESEQREPQENVELLGNKKLDAREQLEAQESTGLCTSKDEEIPPKSVDPQITSESSEPPDGGLKAYLVVLASFLMNGFIFSVINSSSVIYTYLLKQLLEEGVEGAEVKVSLLGVLSIATLFALSPLSGILTALFGMRTTAIAGGCIAALGTFLSSFAGNNVEVLCFTYGIMYGLGCALSYTPSLAVLGQYFKKRVGLVNGVVSIGSPVCTVFMPVILDATMAKFGIAWAFRLISLCSICIALLGLIFQPLTGPKPHYNCKTLVDAVLCTDMWKISQYRLWALFIPIALFGYFVTYVHIKQFVEDLNLNFQSNIPLQCMAVTSAVGRIGFGFLADRKELNNIFLQQLSFYIIGITTIILPFCNSITLLVIISLLLGLFEGGFITLIGPVAVELVGQKYAAQGIGCMLGLASIPLTVGPIIAASLHRQFKNYTVAFILAGLSPVIGATLMFLIHYLNRRSVRAKKCANGGIHRTSRNEHDAEKTPMPLLNGRAHP